MKLKFVKEIEHVILAIAALPVEAETEEIRKKPTKLIRELEQEIRSQFNTGQLPSKQHAVIRRQISYIWEILHAVQVSQMRLQGLDPNVRSDLNKPLDQSNIYKVFVSTVKDIKTEKVLQYTAMIKMALRYGVLYLSDYEIQNLIDCNKIS